MWLISRFWHLNYNTENSAIIFQWKADSICIPPYDSVTQGKRYSFLEELSASGTSGTLRLEMGWNFHFLPGSWGRCAFLCSFFPSMALSVLSPPACSWPASAPLLAPSLLPSPHFSGGLSPFPLVLSVLVSLLPVTALHNPSQAHLVTYPVALRHLFNQSLSILCLPVACGWVLLPWLLSPFSETFSSHTVPTLPAH